MTAAVMKVKFQSLEISDAVRATLDRGVHPYALAIVGPIDWLAAFMLGFSNVPVPDFEVLGRSAPLAPGAKRFDFTAAPPGVPRAPMRGPKPTPQKWEIDLRVEAGEVVPVRVGVYSADIRPTIGPSGEVIPAPVEAAAFVELIAPPWTSGPRTLTTSDGTLKYTIETRPVPTRPATVTGVPAVDKTKSLVQTWTRAVVTITDVEGLYRANPAGGADRVTGYTGLDYCGRIYLNRPRDDPKKWKKDHQSILVSVKVDLVEGLKLGSDAKVAWTIEVPNDVTNDAQYVSRASGALIDPGDYDSECNPIGAHDEGNFGTVDHPKHFEAVPGYALSDVAGDLEKGFPGRTAKTAVVKGVSKVVIHCPNVAGDRIRVRATVEAKALEQDKDHTEVFEDWTGVLHMWNRFDVEYIKAPSAAPLDISAIPRRFGMLRAQLDFVTTNLPKDPDFPAISDEDEANAAEGRLVTRAKTLSKKVGKPGWLFLVSIPKDPDAAPKPSAAEMQWFVSGAAKLAATDDTSETFLAEIDPATWSAIGTKLSAKFEWNDGVPRMRAAMVTLADGGTKTQGDSTIALTRVTVRQTKAYEIQFGFGGQGEDPIGLDVHDSTMARSALWVLPTRQRGEEPTGLPGSANPAAPWIKGGWSAPPSLTISLRRKGWGFTMGVTHWPVSFLYTDNILTVPPEGSLDTTPGTTLHTAVHELTHNFAMVSDQCGFWDWRHELACCMTYGGQWMLGAGKLPLDNVESWSHVNNHEELLRPVPVAAPEGEDHCGRHVAACRRVRFSAHKTGLGW
ncbi:MAG: hypothetical protein U0414_03995 [Polyangiaceae bacterium]